MEFRHAVLVLGVLGCGGRVAAPPPPVTRTSIILPGPTVAPESLRVAATDSAGVENLAPRLNARIVSSRGALDFLDGGGDVLVTDRRAIIAYANSRADYVTVPLPWDRQYVLVAPYAPALHDLVEAVRVDARPATPCPRDTLGDYDPLPRIAYAAQDSTARALADRLVGMSVASRAVRASATDSAYPIIARPIDRTGCDIDGKLVVPLIETRSALIVRRGAVGVVADSAGHVSLTTAP